MTSRTAGMGTRAVFEFPSDTLVWEHKVGVGLGLSNRPWGMSFTGTEGTLVINDFGVAFQSSVIRIFRNLTSELGS